METKDIELASLAHEITDQIKQTIRDTTLNFYRVGLLLKRVRDEKLWQILGNTSFEEYIADPEIGISRTSAYNSIQLVENFEYEEIKMLDYSKVTKVIQALPIAPKTKLLELAGSLSRSDLTKEVASIMGKDPGYAEPIPFLHRCPTCGKLKGITPDDLCQTH